MLVCKAFYMIKKMKSIYFYNKVVTFHRDRNKHKQKIFYKLILPLTYNSTKYLTHFQTNLWKGSQSLDTK